jgi:uncharacterized protein YjcR
MNTKLLTAADLAEMFGVTEQKVMEWQRTYAWPKTTFGRTFRWTPEQVDEITRQHSFDGGGVIGSADGRTQRSASRRKAS